MIKQICTIKGLEEVRDCYWISSQGCILTTAISEKPKIKFGTGRPYLCFALIEKSGKAKTIRIHRLVALAFIENNENKRCVNHIDENKLNNNIKNLEWVTHKENTNHGTLIERISSINHYSSKQKEYYSTNPYARNVFKRTCKRQKWNFEDFEEIFAEWKISPSDGYRRKTYYYKEKV